MPVHVGKRGNQWCVIEPDGTEKKCYDTKHEANAYAAAINANTEKEIMGNTISSDETTSGVTTDSISTGSSYEINPHIATSIEKETPWPRFDDAVIEAMREMGMRNKDLEEALMFGPESFDELDRVRNYMESESKMVQLASDFMSIVGNILSWPGPGKASKVKKLAEELADRLPEDDEEMLEDEEEKEQNEDYVDTGATSNGFFVWKQDDGTYRWLGVYSNKFRDNDKPAEILSEKSHIDFIERVEKGELPYPDLYVWHIKSPIGVADTLAYDDAGFSIASGTIKEEFALALMNTSEDLAMSHGMPSQFIERSKEDPTVITQYVSTEVSVLPRSAAANKRTDFRILKEEATMSIIPEDKRQQVANLLGEDLTAQLESSLDTKGQEAIESGVEFKEEGGEDTQQVEEPTEDVKAEPSDDSAAWADTEGETTEDVTEESLDSDGNVDVGEATEEPATTPGEDVGEQAADQDVFVSKTELVETLAVLVDSFSQNTQQLVDEIKGLREEVEGLKTEKEEDNANVRAYEVPTASLQAMLAKQLAQPAKSVIGTKEAAVHGNAKLANAKPQETEYDEEDGPKEGLFYHRW